VGHAGTLDPFATGLLVVGVGRGATRDFPKLVGLDKEYEAVFALGGRSDTDDRTGKIEGRNSKVGKRIETKELLRAMRALTGDIEQVPPMYAAIKVDGKKLYELARAGKTVERRPRAVTVRSFDLLVADPPSRFDLLPSPLLLPVRIRCSSGTYVRSLARDLGEAIGTGGFVQELRRTAVGPLVVREASPIPSAPPPLIPVQVLLSRLHPSDTVNR
jgi:tRNA pseudouridine55 synthase